MLVRTCPLQVHHFRLALIPRTRRFYLTLLSRDLTDEYKITILHRGRSLSRIAQRLLPQPRLSDIRAGVQMAANLSFFGGPSALSGRSARILMALGNL